MKTLLYILLLPAWMLLSTGCTKPAKVSNEQILRTTENEPVFEVDSWNYTYPENKDKSSKQEKGSYVVTLIKYHPKHAVHTNKLPAYNSKMETIERTRIDDYWSAYLYVTESGSNGGVGTKSHTKMNRSVVFFSLDSAMLSADIEALLNKERLKG